MYFRKLVVVGALASVLAAAFGIAPAQASTRATPNGADPSTFLALGDSLTAGKLEPSISAGIAAGTSWVIVPMAQGESLAPESWATHGKTSGQILAYTVHANTQVLTILAGTNDVQQGVPQATTLNNIAQMVSIVRPTRCAIIVAIPPSSTVAKSAMALNVSLRKLAAQHRYYFVNPWKKYATAKWKWKAGWSSDGVHPNPQTLIGEPMASLIAKLSVRGSCN